MTNKPRHTITRAAAAAALVAATLTAAAPTAAGAACHTTVPLDTRTITIEAAASTYATSRVNGAWVVGDSITTETHRDLNAVMRGCYNPGWTTGVWAQRGVKTEAALNLLPARIARYGAPKVLIVALGTNDRLDSRADPDIVARQVTRVRTMVPASTRIIWLNVWIRSDGTDYPAAVDSARVNHSINRAAPAARVEVLNWYVAVRDGGPAATLIRDGLHPTLAGQALRNNLILSAFRGTGKTTR